MGGTQRAVPTNGTAGVARWLDTAGVGLFAGAVVWTVLVARWTGTWPGNVVLLLFLCGAAHLAGRYLSHLDVRLPQLLAVGFVLGAAARGSFGLASGPAAAPLGYANANGTFYLLGAIAAAGTTFVVRRTDLRVLAVAVCGYLLFAIVNTNSLAASLLLLGVPVGVLAVVALGRAGRRAGPVLAVAGAVAVLAALGVTTTLAMRHDVGSVPVAAEQRVVHRLDEVRLQLWSEAMTVHRDNPWTGAGINRFQRESPTAASDRDLRWAHHGFLQQAAEQGTVGLALLVGGFLWGFARLGVARGRDPLIALAAVALASLGIHANADYVLHFAAIPPMVALLVGAAVGRDQRAGGGPESSASGRHGALTSENTGRCDPSAGMIAPQAVSDR